MSEYIVTCDDETAMWVGNDVKSMRPIVRCRDCKHYAEPDYLNMVSVCKFTRITAARHPDGFCAWGKRREQ